MDRRTFLKSSGALLLVETGCTAIQHVADNAPAAKTPVLRTISAVVGRTCAWQEFSPNVAGNYEFLPSCHPTGDIRVVVGAPYPSKLQIDIDGQQSLHEFDNSQTPLEGYYKINSITLAPAKDTFDWDVTVTPPSSTRMAVQFRLNITNVSTNPAYSGTAGTSEPLRLQLGRISPANVHNWLLHHDAVRDAIVWEAPAGAVSYSSWTGQQRQALNDMFTSAWEAYPLQLQDPPPNTASPADSDPPLTVLAEADAWQLYVAHIAYNLAVELAGWTSWSITTYPQDQLEQLFDSRQMFRWNPVHQGYDICEVWGSEMVVLASPRTTLAFLYENGIYRCRSRLDVITRMLEWCRQNLSHFAFGFTAKNMEDQWQYRGCPPVIRIIEGTPWPGSPAPNSAGVLHRTAGCWGTTAFLRATLRVLNIPVKLEKHEGHALPSFVTEALYLSHGDDPYSRLSKATPPFPAGELLIDQGKFDQWFGPNVAHSEAAQNVGRRVLELALQYLPDELLRNRCKDQAANVANADSEVFKSFSARFTVAELEAQNLWTRIDAKISDLGGCANVPK